MTFTLFLLGLLIILGIARYNESNKLFWTLAIVFTLGYAGTKMVYDTIGKKEQSGKSLDQAYPTQGLYGVKDSCICFFNDASNMAIVKETSNLVSQVYTPGYIEQTTTLSDVSGVTQGIYIHVLPNPPNDVGIIDDS